MSSWVLSVLPWWRMFRLPAFMDFSVSMIRDSRGFKYWKRQRLRKRKHYKI